MRIQKYDRKRAKRNQIVDAADNIEVQDNIVNTDTNNENPNPNNVTIGE